MVGKEVIIFPAKSLYSASYWYSQLLGGWYGITEYETIPVVVNYAIHPIKPRGLPRSMLHVARVILHIPFSIMITTFIGFENQGMGMQQGITGYEALLLKRNKRLSHPQRVLGT